MNNQESGAIALCLVPGLLCGFPVLLVLVTALVPTHFNRARRIASTHPWQSFLLGLVNFVFFLAIVAVFGESAFAPLKGIAILSLFIVLPLMAVALIADGVSKLINPQPIYRAMAEDFIRALCSGQHEKGKDAC